MTSHPYSHMQQIHVLYGNIETWGENTATQSDWLLLVAMSFDDGDGSVVFTSLNLDKQLAVLPSFIADGGEVKLAKTVASLGGFFLHSPSVLRFILSHCSNNSIWVVMELMYLFRDGC